MPTAGTKSPVVDMRAAAPEGPCRFIGIDLPGHNAMDHPLVAAPLRDVHPRMTPPRRRLTCPDILHPLRPLLMLGGVVKGARHRRSSCEVTYIVVLPWFLTT